MPSVGYVNPFPFQYSVGRTDQGVDFEAGSKNVGAPILAMGRARVVFVSRQYQGYGQYVSYQLLDGPLKGRAIFIGHSKVGDVKVGQLINAGDSVATVEGYGSWPGHIEIGWADPHNPGNTLARSMGTVTGGSTPEGQDFREFFSNANSYASDHAGDVPGGLGGESQSDSVPAFFDVRGNHPSDIQQTSVSESSGPDLVGQGPEGLVSLWESIANQQFSSPDSRLFAQNARLQLP